MARPLDVGFLMMPTENAETGVAPRWSEILEMARRGEELGYDSLWIPDHLNLVAKPLYSIRRRRAIVRCAHLTA